MRKLFLAFLITFSYSISSCDPAYRAQSVEYNTYRVTKEQKEDPSVALLMKPYRDSVNKSMNQVIGVLEVDLDKKPTESTLGNFVADALLEMSKEKSGMHVDAAFVNYGGIRLTQLAKGEVTRGKIFELMPFDNIIILQKMKGDVFQQFLDLTAAKGGWPLAGLTMQIRDKKAVNVMVNGKPLDPNATYTVLNSDYVVNGGDNADMLRSLPQITHGYLVRDAIFDYIRRYTQQGKSFSAKIENRVTNAQ